MIQYDPNTDYYEILQVHPRAHAEVIKRAYRTILGLLQAHPDLGGNHETAVRVTTAYTVLSDPEQRRAYDHERQRWQPFPAPSPSTRHSRMAPHLDQPVSTVTRATSPARRLLCPHCGRPNRLPREITVSRAACGHCHAPLTHPTGETAISPSRPRRRRHRDAIRRLLRGIGKSLRVAFARLVTWIAGRE